MAGLRPQAVVMIWGLDETPQPRYLHGTARGCVRNATVDDVGGCLGEAHKGGSRGELNTHRLI
jgi:hypothetical protein